MSKNSKNARRVAERKMFARATNGPTGPVSTGRKGPAQTTPKHGKKNAWFQQYSSYGDFYAAQQKGGKKKAKQTEDEAA